MDFERIAAGDTLAQARRLRHSSKHAVVTEESVEQSARHG